jgi:hypothetical protein
MRFIEDLAIARFNIEKDAVEVDFYGEGDIVTYREAIQVAINMATAHGVNKWVFLKTNFKDLDSYKFLSFIKEWMKPTQAELGEQREVIILTKIQAHRKMNMVLKYNDLYNKDFRIGNSLNISVALKEGCPISYEFQKSA